jgi:diguanylate cyclase (GGDEF)-like protein
VLLDHAAATRAFLLFVDGEDIEVEVAADRIDRSVVARALGAGRRDDRHPLLTDVCWPAVRFAVHTREPLVVADPSTDRRFRADRALRSRAPRALLSLPIGIGNDVRGLLLMESDRSAKAFDVGRMEGLRVLATQAVTAAATARLSSNVSDLGADIASLRTLAGELATQAERDPLTGVDNRRGLDARLAELQRADAGTSVGVMYVDLDSFKVVNDVHGHAAGDVVLVAVAGRLRTVVRTADTVARLGGDEFIVVSTGLSAGELTALAERTLAAIQAPIELADGTAVVVGASIGVHLLPGGSGLSADDLDGAVDGADQAMYQAKRAGKNQVLG